MLLSGVVCTVGTCFQLGPVDLAIEAGCVCVLEGANGAGKTTLLRVAAGLLPLTAGHRVCAGTALYLRAGAGARNGQRVVGAIRSAAALAGRTTADARVAVREVGLGDLTDRRVGTLSAGERMRVTLAVALVVTPALLCLDEPFGPLDADGGELVRRVVAQLAERGSTVMVSSPRQQLPHDEADARLLIDDGIVRVA